MCERVNQRIVSGVNSNVNDMLDTTEHYIENKDKYIFVRFTLKTKFERLLTEHEPYTI